MSRTTTFVDNENMEDIEQKQEKLLHAVKAIKNIEEVVASIVKSGPKWIHLVEAVDSRVDKTLGILRPQALADHRSLLSSLGWPPPLLTSTSDKENGPEIPNPLLLMQGTKKERYSQSFLALCALQHLQAQRESRQQYLATQDKGYQLLDSSVLCNNPCIKCGLWTIDELVSPIASRMEHHFSRWSDQPKFIFALVYRITRDFIGVDDILQPLIDKARLTGCSAKEGWVSAMVKVLSGYLTKQMFSLLAERYYDGNGSLDVTSSWLHLVDLMISFDKRMLQLAVSGTPLLCGELADLNGISRDISVVSIFCDHPDWLKIWAEIEFKDAKEKLKVEVENSQAWMVGTKQERQFIHEREAESFLLSTREEYKAPLIVEFVVKITWSMIERCRTLPNIVLRIQFMKSTAVRFLHVFFDLLLERCQVFESADAHIDDDALLRISSSINAARYCESFLEEWSGGIDFLEMGITTNDMKGWIDSELDQQSCFFRDEIKMLTKFETEWIEEILAVLLRQFDALCWYYIQSGEQWEQADGEFVANQLSGVENMTVSADFIEALDEMRERLHVLKVGLNSKDFLDLWRSTADGLDHFLFSCIPLSGVRFSTQGVYQFGADMRTLFLIFHPFCARPEAFFPLISNAMKLLEMGREDAARMLAVLSKGERKMDSLHACGMYHVSPTQAEKILRSRKF